MGSEVQHSVQHWDQQGVVPTGVPTPHHRVGLLYLQITYGLHCSHTCVKCTKTLLLGLRNPKRVLLPNLCSDQFGWVCETEEWWCVYGLASIVSWSWCWRISSSNLHNSTSPPTSKYLDASTLQPPTYGGFRISSNLNLPSNLHISRRPTFQPVKIPCQPLNKNTARWQPDKTSQAKHILRYCWIPLQPSPDFSNLRHLFKCQVFQQRGQNLRIALLHKCIGSEIKGVSFQRRTKISAYLLATLVPTPLIHPFLHHIDGWPTPFPSSSLFKGGLVFGSKARFPRSSGSHQHFLTIHSSMLTPYSAHQTTTMDRYHSIVWPMRTIEKLIHSSMLRPYSAH